MAIDFKVGDTVKVKSGGPLMTISAVADDGAETVWFNTADGCESRRFPLATLRHDDGDSGVEFA